jgi:hypothetical protein
MSGSLVAIIKGGLGNQLFGYAAARALALRTGRELLLDDRSGFVRDGYGRSFRLDRFPIAARPAPPELSLGDPKSPGHRRLRNLDRLLPPPWKCYVKERPGRGADQLARLRSRRRVVHLNGYWQDEACFREAAEILRRELAPPPSGDAALEDELASGDHVFLHIRQVRYSPRLDFGYYREAIHRAVETLEAPCFEVFGDDPERARKALDFSGRPVRFHEPSDDELVDFRRMTRCRHAIVANSSFSWWAAWLQAPDHHVWTPEKPGWPLRPAAGWNTVPNKLEHDG